MNIIQSIFNRKKLVPNALEPFGFEREGSVCRYAKELPGSGFKMAVSVTETGEVRASVTDPSLDEPYTLHLASGATGGFVGEVKSEYEKLLTEIAQKCFEPDVFKTAQAKELIAYVRETYGDELEYLWAKFPDNAVWRRSDNSKWYGALLTVPQRKLGIDSDEVVEIIDLRADPDELAALVDNERYFPGWHMNKKSWFTIILGSGVSTGEICKRIDASRALADKNKKSSDK